MLALCACSLLLSADAIPRNLLATKGTKQAAKNKETLKFDHEKKGKMKDALRGQVPAKFDDTAAKNVFDKLRQDKIDKLSSSYSTKDKKKAEKVKARPTINQLAAKGWHMQLPRDGEADLKKIDDLKRDKTISKDELAKKTKAIESRWSNNNPAKDIAAMLKGGKTKDPTTGKARKPMKQEEVDKKIKDDKGSYLKSAEWKLGQKDQILSKISSAKLGGLKPQAAPITPMDNVQVKTMDETIGAQLARKEKDTGEKQKAGALFKKLDVNGNGLLERSESDEVASYFSQFGIEGESINFDSFKTGVRTGRKTEEKSQRDKTKQMLADRRKQEAATALVAKKAAKAAKVKVDEA